MKMTRMMVITVMMVLIMSKIALMLMMMVAVVKEIGPQNVPCLVSSHIPVPCMSSTPEQPAQYEAKASS